jgi:drug/metabolite transporter (DMT)-like permease
LQTIGLKATTVGNVSFITGIYVVFVPLLGYFFFKRVNIFQILIGVVTFIGLAIFSFDANMRTNTGDILVLISSVAYALHFLTVCKITNKYDSMLLTFGQIAGATIFCGIAAAIMEPLPTAANFTNNIFFALIFCALLSTCVAFFIQIYAQKILSPTQASVLFTAEVFFGAFFGWLLLDEIFSIRQFLGAGILALCMIAVILIPWLEMKRSKSNAVKFDL